MGTIDAVTIIVAVLLAGLGLVVGFGRTLKFFTKGIFGIILSVFVCVTFGGMIQGIPAVADWLSGLERVAGRCVGISGDHHSATVIFLHRALCRRADPAHSHRQVHREHFFHRRAADAHHQPRARHGADGVAAVLLLTLLVIRAHPGVRRGHLRAARGRFLGTLYHNNPVRFS